jgi:hypothetical protein
MGGLESPGNGPRMLNLCRDGAEAVLSDLEYRSTDLFGSDIIDLLARLSKIRTITKSRRFYASF